jgi:F-type H+-transporting ATPase subunit b
MINTIAQVLSQALAFFCFYWILKKYAWGTILGLIDERNAKIEEAFRRSEEAEKQAAELKEKYEEHMRNVETEARERIRQAVDEGRRVAAEINETARADAEAIQAKAKQSVEIEMAKARVELKDDVVRMTLAAAEKLINERMTEAGHRRLVEEFVEELSRQS